MLLVDVWRSLLGVDILLLCSVSPQFLWLCVSILDSVSCHHPYNPDSHSQIPQRDTVLLYGPSAWHSQSNRNHLLAAGVGVAMTMAAFGEEASMTDKVGLWNSRSAYLVGFEGVKLLNRS